MQWIIELDDLGWNKHTCPNCGYTKRTDIHVSLGWNYCPICGENLADDEKSYFHTPGSDELAGSGDERKRLYQECFGAAKYAYLNEERRAQMNSKG